MNSIIVYGAGHNVEVKTVIADFTRTLVDGGVFN